jgi:hypothetical protein
MNKTILAVALSLFTITSTAMAQESVVVKPAGKSKSFSFGDGSPRKHWFSDPKWWIGEGVIAASIFADGYTTSHRPAGLVEGNRFVLGYHPSTKRLVTVNLIAFGAQTSLHAGAWHFTHHIPYQDRSLGYTQDRLGWRIVGYTGIPTTVALFNGRNAIKNYELIQRQK